MSNDFSINSLTDCRFHELNSAMLLDNKFMFAVPVDISDDLSLPCLASSSACSL